MFTNILNVYFEVDPLLTAIIETYINERSFINDEKGENKWIPYNNSKFLILFQE